MLSVFAIGNYVLGMARNVDEAVALLQKHQIVSAALTAKVAYGPNRDAEGISISDIPIHYVLRDRAGRSAVIEFIAGQVIIHANAGDVMTNEPPYPVQLANAKKYAGIDKSINNNSLLENLYRSMMALNSAPNSAADVVNDGSNSELQHELSPPPSCHRTLSEQVVPIKGWSIEPLALAMMQRGCG